jgi:hypothetical protein
VIWSAIFIILVSELLFAAKINYQSRDAYFGNGYFSMHILLGLVPRVVEN